MSYESMKRVANFGCLFLVRTVFLPSDPTEKHQLRERKKKTMADEWHSRWERTSTTIALSIHTVMVTKRTVHLDDISKRADCVRRQRVCMSSNISCNNIITNRCAVFGGQKWRFALVFRLKKANDEKKTSNAICEDTNTNDNNACAQSTRTKCECAPNIRIEHWAHTQAREQHKTINTHM